MSRASSSAHGGRTIGDAASLGFAICGDRRRRGATVVIADRDAAAAERLLPVEACSVIGACYGVSVGRESH